MSDELMHMNFAIYPNTMWHV